MSQNRLIALLLVILLLVIGASVYILMSPSPVTETPTPTRGEEVSATDDHFPLDILQQPGYKLLNRQLVKEGALPVQPSTTAGKANPFL